jgi:putative DNA primase/helicase
MTYSIKKEVRLNEIPEELKKTNQWVAWKAIPDKGKMKKIPINPATGKSARVNDSSTWASFDEAVSCFKNQGLSGIGFVFTKNDPFVGIDFDKCFIDETLSPEIEAMVKTIGSYTEISPSGKGLHTLVKGKLPEGGIRQDKIEIYDNLRFFTITGDLLPGSPQEIIEANEILERLLEQHCKKENVDSDIAILEKAFQKDSKYRNLWAGNYHGYPSHSEADLAFCRFLARHFDKQVDIDRVFRKSGLFRSKWDERHSFSGTTYGQMTISKSISQVPVNNQKQPDKQKTSFNLTDIGNAERLAHYYRDKILYCHVWKKWLVWDGIKWADDDSGYLKILAKKTVRKIFEEARFVEDDSKRQAIARHALSSESNGRIKAMVSLAQSELPIKPDVFDKNKYFLNVKNGTIDLKTGILHPHKKENYITKVAPVVYDKNAECPEWERFLDRILDGNENLISFMQRAVGYSLSGDVSEQCLFIFWGAGANGKSTFLRTIGTLMGDYSQHAATETILLKKGGGIPNDLARMKGARFVTCSEAEAEHKLAENLIKQMTGDDLISARFLHQEWFEFEPEYKLFLGTNNRPIIKGDEHAIWRRIRLVPFNVIIPEEEKDLHLLEKLKNEMSGILNWALKGAMAWQEDGLGTPPEVIEATNEYRTDMDLIGEFINECCIQGPDVKVPSKNLYLAYSNWCENSGEYQLKQNWFGRKLREKGFENKPLGSKRARYWLGIDLMDKDLGESEN